MLVRPEESTKRDLDEMAIGVFLKALEIAGGPRKLIAYRNLTWLPSLLEAAYAVVLKEEFMKTEDDIAQFLGLTRQTVRNILQADPEAVMERLSGELRQKGPRAHIAGGLAKRAFKEMRRGTESPDTSSLEKA